MNRAIWHGKFTHQHTCTWSASQNKFKERYFSNRFQVAFRCGKSISFRHSLLSVVCVVSWQLLLEPKKWNLVLQCTKYWLEDVTVHSFHLGLKFQRYEIFEFWGKPHTKHFRASLPLPLDYLYTATHESTTFSCSTINNGLVQIIKTFSSCSLCLVIVWEEKSWSFLAFTVLYLSFQVRS